MGEEITAWKAFRVELSGKLTSAVVDCRTAKKTYRTGVRNWPKKGYGPFLCFETREQAERWARNQFMGLVVTEIWEVKIRKVALHERDDVAVFNFAQLSLSNWPTGTIAAKYVRLVRGVISI